MMGGKQACHGKGSHAGHPPLGVHVRAGRCGRMLRNFLSVFPSWPAASSTLHRAALCCPADLQHRPRESMKPVLVINMVGRAAWALDGPCIHAWVDTIDQAHPCELQLWLLVCSASVQAPRGCGNTQARAEHAASRGEARQR